MHKNFETLSGSDQPPNARRQRSSSDEEPDRKAVPNPNGTGLADESSKVTDWYCE
jgi:hypothetical protein